ncbi:response regulator [Pendulispora brunnea]|uniref:Response regulator n=1 Tax=Pendulispora brunnea TaxID=2905690 RepID=A0ABZ2JYY8_9BACT
MPVPRKGQPLQVLIVSDNPETLDALVKYLGAAGATVAGTRELERCAEMTPGGASAVVLFPDDFEKQTVLDTLHDLGVHRPNTLPVLVTSESKQFRALPAATGRVAPLIVPKPVWGWTLLDAIRAELESRDSQR